MRLQDRLVVTNIGIIIFLMIFIICTSYFVIVGSFSNLEENVVKQDMNRARGIIQSEINDLSLLAGDWSHWDDTYYFVKGENEGYIDETLLDETLENIETIFVIFGDTNNQSYYETYYYPEGEVILEKVKTEVSRDNLFLDMEEREGIMVLGGVPIIFSTRFITKSDFSGGDVGTLTMARIIDEEKLEALSDRLGYPLEIFPSEESFEEVVMEKDSDRIEAFTTINGVFGEPLTVKISTSRDIYKRGKKAMNFFIISIVLFGLLYILLSYFFNRIISKRITTPLNKISEAAINIGEGKPINVGEYSKAEKEVQYLAQTIDAMKEKIYLSQKKIKDANKELELKVKKRTEDLMIKNKELEKINKMAIGRELKMAKLKEEMEKLKDGE